jgi:hypothetical protein
MRDRAERFLRYAGLALGALVLLQVAYALFQACQLVGVKVPAVPTLEAETNLTIAAMSPESTVHSPQSSKAPSASPAERQQDKISGASNMAALDLRNAKTNLVSTGGAMAAGTNLDDAGSAVEISKKYYPRNNRMGVMGLNGATTMPGMPGQGPALPPKIQAQVDRIVNSGIFGPVMHPLPMGLLGIAGDTAFLRTDSGQSGLVKEGDSLGDLKLLRIGINRVLVEQDGQKKELTIFDGYGGDSLLSNKIETQNENIQIQKKAD